MLQYRLKYETVRTQMSFQNNNFLFNLFSLSSQYLIQHFLSLLTVSSLSNPCSLSLSSSNHPPSPSKQQYGGLTDQAVSSFYVRHHSTLRWPHRSTVHHRSTSLFGILITLSPRWSRNRRSQIFGFMLVPVVDVDVDVGW